MSDEPGQGRIHVDSDWKEEAQRDKERLAQEEQAAVAQAQGPLPEPTIPDLLNMIAMPAMMAIGGYKTPEGQIVPPDLTAAKYHIDLLGLIEEKTRGNLTAEETNILSTVLHQLRMQFVSVAGGKVPDLGQPPPAPKQD